MPRANRQQPGGVVFHVLNRGNERRDLFDNPADYDAFLRVLAEAGRHTPVAILAYCLMPNHWHLVVRPCHDGDLGRFMQRLTVTHVRRWREHRHTVGLGHLYQGTYKSFPVQDDGHFLAILVWKINPPLHPPTSTPPPSTSTTGSISIWSLQDTRLTTADLITAVQAFRGGRAALTQAVSEHPSSMPDLEAKLRAHGAATVGMYNPAGQTITGIAQASLPPKQLSILRYFESTLWSKDHPDAFEHPRSSDAHYDFEGWIQRWEPAESKRIGIVIDDLTTEIRARGATVPP